MAAFLVQPTNPFPTFWRTAEGTAALINLLPKDQQEISFYINAFQRRALSCVYPNLPDQWTEIEVQRFLSNVKENSDQHPDMLALVFATLAQGVQNGVYDKYGGAWHGGVMETECRMANAFSKDCWPPAYEEINVPQLLLLCSASGLLRSATDQNS